uniref:Coiled-coil domain-containing protein 93 n=1 Tax=Ciona intestinalis TaxID=7719 RepID=F6Y444_CIOIN
KVGANFDQDGNEREVETKEDEEQEVKLNEIVDLLVAAGYFRARIKGLSSFDKVVGGMTWSISNCSFDVDVDLLFQENSTIGQKISLTEKIVSVLPKMNCPYQIEPHQIQGQDFKSIFPVIQWLVKKVIETREESGDHIRSYSISQFQKHYKTPEDLVLEEKKDQMLDAVRTLRNVYRPVRKYKIKDKSALVTEEAITSATLLEYGQRRLTNFSRSSNRRKKSKEDGEDKVKSGEGKSEELQEDEEEMIQIAQEKTLQDLMGDMSAMSGKEIEGKLATRIIGSIVEMQSSEIHEVSNMFKQKNKEMRKTLAVKTVTPRDLHKTKMEALESQLKVKQDEMKLVKREFQEIKQKEEEVQKKLDAAAIIDEKIEEVKHLEKNADEATVEMLRSLVMMNEQLKRQEAMFKAHCKEEAMNMKEEIKHLQARSEEVASVDDENESVVMMQLKGDQNKLAKMRLLLASKNRLAATLARKIDEVPTRAELTQYQKRFVELYDQISLTHKETKQFYTMYNTLEDSRRYLEKEVDLLDSIYDNFSAAKQSPDNMQQYLKQFEKIVEGVKGNKIKVEKKRQEEKMKRNVLHDRYTELVEKHREYVKTIQSFQEECRKNEILSLNTLEGNSR